MLRAAATIPTFKSTTSNFTPGIMIATPSLNLALHISTPKCGNNPIKTPA